MRYRYEPTNNAIQELRQEFNNLFDLNRLLILEKLIEGPQTSSTFYKITGLSIGNLANHMARLKAMKFVTSKKTFGKHGIVIEYQLTPNAIIKYKSFKQELTVLLNLDKELILQ